MEAFFDLFDALHSTKLISNLGVSSRAQILAAGSSALSSPSSATLGILHDLKPEVQRLDLDNLFDKLFNTKKRLYLAPSTVVSLTLSIGIICD